MRSNCKRLQQLRHPPQNGQRMRQYTIKDIARELGVSPSTVSRALSGHPGISARTRSRVQELARLHNYQPNLLAKSLQQKHSSTIGVIVPEIRHDFFAATISGIEEVAYTAGYAIMVCQSHETLDRETTNIAALLGQRIAGLLLSVSCRTHDARHLAPVLRSRTPLVVFDRVPEGFAGSTVTTDDEQGACDITALLLQKGYRRIAHIGGPPHLAISRRRYAGYAKALAAAGMPQFSGYHIQGGFDEEDGRRGAMQLFDLAQPPDAIMAVTDPVALGVYSAARQRGLRIPQDIAVTGFSGNPVGELITPRLTTVYQPAFEMGRRAAGLLLEQIRGTAAQSTATVSLPTRVVVRESA
jgi:LacI family transcriptional regulator